MAIETHIRRSGKDFAVAFGAVQRAVRTVDSKLRRMFVSHTLLPIYGSGKMAGFALHRKCGALVIWIFGLVKIVHVAGETAVRGAGKLVEQLGCVAGLTIGNRMCTGQRKSPFSVNLQHILGIVPALRRMAILAIHAQIACVRICVTIEAGAGCVGKFEGVAAHTIGGLMHPFQRKPGVIVIKIHLLFQRCPRIRCVAIDAIPFDFPVGIV